ncbi:hypothetical protein J3F84DRAFT_304982 [Trichoderma pleuroticola]
MDSLRAPSSISTDSEEESTEEIEESDAFYEEENPNFEDIIGGLKTNNPVDNRYQRRYIHTSDKMSRFCKKVETVLVVHGWESPDEKQPMTLIILSVRLNVQGRRFRIKSARMWFSFHEDTKRQPANKEKASPEVVAFAPYVQQFIGDQQAEQREETASFGANIGTEQYAKFELQASKEVKRSFTRQHFDRGTADYLISNDRPYGVSWFCEQNDLQTFGVKPHFYLAVLLTRNHTAADNTPITFSGIYDMRIEAGSFHDIRRGVRRAFRLGRPQDEAIYYNPDPTLEDQVGGLEGEGLKIKEKITKNNLVKFREKGELAKLLPELQPMAPKKE